MAGGRMDPPHCSQRGPGQGLGRCVGWDLAQKQDVTQSSLEMRSWPHPGPLIQERCTAALKGRCPQSPVHAQVGEPPRPGSGECARQGGWAGGDHVAEPGWGLCSESGGILRVSGWRVRGSDGIFRVPNSCFRMDWIWGKSWGRCIGDTQLIRGP